ncbi:MAG TPA: hypothetical protein VG269_29525, partial [Tepidisphaeraceae bacterium]|nr:hypothetical protein [Tepidisphaeraceae bacterium]
MSISAIAKQGWRETFCGVLLPCVGAVVLLAGLAAGARGDVRPIWGGESLWGYWEFGNDYVPKGDWKI